MFKSTFAVIAVLLACGTTALAQSPQNPQSPQVPQTLPAPGPSATSTTPAVGAATGVQSNTLQTPLPVAPSVPPAPTPPNPMITMADGSTVPIFGANLFTGAFASTRPGAQPTYLVQPGDQIAVRIFGAVNSDAVTTVDPYGRLFIQGIGPVTVGGIQAGQLQAKVSAAVQAVYTNAVGVYVGIVNGGTLGIYVTGNVERAGRYVGNPDDSLLYYLDQSGGIDPQRGSLRNIAIRRGDAIVARYDLYDFILRGMIAPFRFLDGDVIVVGDRGALVAATGDVRNAFAFEAPPGGKTIAGRELISLAIPLSTTTSTSVSQSANGLRNATYYPLAQLAGLDIIDSSTVVFRSEVFTQTINVSLQGDIKGQTAFSVPRGALLSQLLAQVPLDGTDIVRENIHLIRPSVAVAQKDALNRSLDVLQREVLTQPVYGTDSANAKTADVAAVQQYIAQARQAQPDGAIAVYTDGKFHDLRLESGDVVVMPSRTDVVIVTGQVLSPGAYSHGATLSARDYIDSAGGFGQNANKKRLVFRHLDGSSVVADGKAQPRPGDQIVVLPKFGQSAGIEIFKDLTQIVFQIASTAGVAVAIIDK